MKKISIFFLLIPLFFLSACNVSLNKTPDKASDEINNTGRQSAQNADVEDLGGGWKWQNGTLYFHEWSTKLDRDSFRILNDKYVKDKDGVYFCYLDGCSLLDRDPETFVVLDSLYQKDKNGVYLGSEKLVGANPESFVVLSQSFSKDNDQAFYGLKEITGADQTTFEVLNNKFSKDSRHVFYEDEVATGLDAETFSILGDNYAKDKTGVYYCQNYCKKFSSLSDDFRVLSDGYAKNTTEIFYNGEKIIKADPDTFSVVGGGYAKDNLHIYLNGANDVYNIEKNYQLYLLRHDPKNCSSTEHPAKDLDSYIDLGQGYGKDNQCAFYFDWPIDKGQASSFTVLDKNYSLDRNYAYYARPDYKDIIRINNSIPSSFRVVGQGFAGDEESIYFGALTVHADVDTFKAIDPDGNKWGFNGEDKDAYYKGTQRTLKFLAK